MRNDLLRVRVRYLLRAPMRSLLLARAFGRMPRKLPAIVGVVFEEALAANERDAEADQRGHEQRDEEIGYERIALEPGVQCGKQEEH